jgi:Fe-Mn family superoxide dismutase
MTIEAKKFDHLVGKLEGFSERQLTQHFGLYEGYVKKLNEIRQKIAAIPYDQRTAKSNFSFGDYTELRRREATPYNGVYLHELYFENLGPKPRESRPSGELRGAIEKAFGSISNWEADLEACGTAATNGWVLLTFDEKDLMLHHNQVFEHADRMMVGTRPVLALDAWEHAFMIDYGTDKASYMKAFLRNIDWQAVNERFESVSREAAARV